MSTEKKYKTGSMRDRTEQPHSTRTHPPRKRRKRGYMRDAYNPQDQTKKKQQKTTKNSFSFRLWAISPFAALPLSSFSYFL